MRLGAALFLIAVGAILTWAVEVDSKKGFDINNAGVILMVVGGIGLIAELIYMSVRRRSTVVQGGVAAPPRQTTTYVNSPPPGY
ncbi:MAG: hypothetical protein QOH89_340 [Pseudonocardiales bacterium]|jgi:hypothetical protein|nr:hypothetical protein [Pseudonocardiales bacterium]MDT4943144.1 hypothetical protein [Pseudonocardiales bacterium]